MILENYKDDEDYNNNHSSMLSAIGYNEHQIFSIEIREDHFLLQEDCDQWYSVKLTPSELKNK